MVIEMDVRINRVTTEPSRLCNCDIYNYYSGMLRLWVATIMLRESEKLSRHFCVGSVVVWCARGVVMIVIGLFSESLIQLDVWRW